MTASIGLPLLGYLIDIASSESDDVIRREYPSIQDDTTDAKKPGKVEMTPIA